MRAARGTLDRRRPPTRSPPSSSSSTPRPTCPTPSDEFDGAQTQSSRLILTDGREIEITTIWVGPHDNVVLWPDATVWRTEWGSPRVVEAYADVAQIHQESADELPVVVLPG
ncbi:hypothetical protein NH287_14595 [Microbacterium sp. CnD16-F]|uniref:hypothetical protein n=1 Tax=Microbacterium sp. CnD16-F TaxID=2954493 RepID=UPI0020977F07|nr:hypothetical protein [Microbacterium sp. CnD16-F]MCO7204717.1 hypothetical protein [Microbacterium sp. CnD16-F]